MRIVSLLPSATETVFALGAGEQLVGVGHGSDWPEEAADLPTVVIDRLGSGLAHDERRDAIRALQEQGEQRFSLDGDLLIELEPDLIITQEVLETGAVEADGLRTRLAERMERPPTVMTLDPMTFGEVLGTVRTIAEAIARRDEGVAIIEDAAGRVDRVKLAVRDAAPVPLLALRALDPPVTAGHWVPQTIELAGGFDVLALPGEPPEVRSWEELQGTGAEIAVVMEAEMDAGEGQEAAYDVEEELTALGVTRAVAVDGRLFSRSGPRVVDGLELLAHLLHPDLVPEAPAAALELGL